MATNLRMPEGMLTGKKGRIVSNGYLARANLAAGLDSFIFYKIFTGAKWRPKYTSHVLADPTPPAKQQKGSKLIADIIESLIGASYVVGGFPKALACMQAILPLEKWTPIPQASSILHNAAPTEGNAMNLALVEELIGHSFTKKSLLLEALTHSTYRGLNTHCSYERLEFFGDAVLEYIISRRLYAHKPELSHANMHGIRTAVINAPFLTYRMFETTVEEELTNKATLQPEVHHRALWQFLRSSSYDFNVERDKAHKQYVDARATISHALEHSTRFPWHAFSLYDPPKFLSDIVESVLGALYIDTHGSIPACEAFAQRLGILPTLEHILANEIDCFHPKERLNVMAQNKGCKYFRVASNGEDDAWGLDGGDKVYRVQVRIGGENVGGPVEGVKKLQAETIAAWKALAVLEGRVCGYMGMNGHESGAKIEAGGTQVSEDVTMGEGGDGQANGGVYLRDTDSAAINGDGSENEFFDAEEGDGNMLEE
jgi:dsRNA-specific ribonuclease